MLDSALKVTVELPLPALWDEVHHLSAIFNVQGPSQRTETDVPPPYAGISISDGLTTIVVGVFAHESARTATNNAVKNLFIIMFIKIGNWWPGQGPPIYLH